MHLQAESQKYLRMAISGSPWRAAILGGQSRRTASASKHLGWTHPPITIVLSLLIIMCLVFILTRKRVLKQEHPDTLTSMANLASASRGSRTSERGGGAIHVDGGDKRLLSQGHPDTLSSMESETRCQGGEKRRVEVLGSPTMEERQPRYGGQGCSWQGG